jgi:hypothetical protein
VRVEFEGIESAGTSCMKINCVINQWHNFSKHVIGKATAREPFCFPGKHDSSLCHQEISTLLRKPNMLIMGIQMMVPFRFINFFSDKLTYNLKPIDFITMNSR